MKLFNQKVFILLCVISLSAPICYSLQTDPTRPVGISAGVRASQFTLSAIIVSPDRRLAVINGHIVHIGDQFDTVRVIAIEENKVELIGPQGKLILRLLTSPLKRSRVLY